MRKVIAIVGALVLVLAAAGASHAVLLSDLLNGGSITAGDKLFDNWSLVNYMASDSARTFNAANIDVTALTGGGLDPGPGLSFTVSNKELSVTGDGIYAFVDLMFGFKVSVLDPNYKIKDNTLAYEPGGAMLSWLVDGSYDLGNYIREEIGTAPGQNDLGTKNIEFSILGLPDSQTSKFTDSASFAPQSEIWVTKNILVWSVDTTDTSAIYGFGQHFSQIPVGLPEPGMLSLLALGGLALLRFKRS